MKIAVDIDAFGLAAGHDNPASARHTAQCHGRISQKSGQNPDGRFDGAQRPSMVPEPVEGPRHNAQHGRQAEITEAIRRQANDFRTDGDGAALAVRHPILGKKTGH